MENKEKNSVKFRHLKYKFVSKHLVGARCSPFGIVNL